MEIRPLPFMPLNLSADKAGTPTFNQTQRDGYFQQYDGPDGPRFIWRKRPGLTVFKNLGENGPVDGAHYWTRQNLGVFACNGKMFTLNAGGTQTNITGTATQTALVRPTFADVSGTNLYAASSGKIGEYSTTTGAYLTDPQAPTAVRFLDTINQILVALQDNSERFDWSDAGAPTSWAGLFATNETSPDLTKAFKAANAYLFFWGQDSLELWRDDGTTFVRETQGAIQQGTIAPYSLTENKGTFFWLNEDRQVVEMRGLEITIISDPMLSEYIDSFSTVSDAKGDYLKIQGKEFYILSFPTEGISLAFDIALRQWYKWGFYDTATATYQQYLANCIIDAKDWNKVLAGDRRTGIVYEVGGTDDNGEPIRSVIRTDFIDHNYPDTWKRSHELTLVFKRADTNTTPKTMLIRYRDDGSTDWSAYRTVNVEAQGKTELRVNERRWGKYKRRQWEFVMSDSTQAALLSAHERFDIGR